MTNRFSIVAATLCASLSAIPLLPASASAHERRSRSHVVQRCDHDGDACAAFRCDWDGDDCVQIGPWHRVYAYRSPYDGYSGFPDGSYGRSFGDRRREEWSERRRDHDHGGDRDEWREHHGDEDDGDD